MDSLEPQVSDELAELVDAWSSLIEEVVRLAEAVGRSKRSGAEVRLTVRLRG